MLLPLCAAAQEALLKAGPMVGAAGLQEAKLWVQTSEPANVHFEVFALHNPDSVFWSPIAPTLPDRAYSTVVQLRGLKPGTRYGYRLFLNEQPVPLPYTLEFSTLPDTASASLPEIRFAAGSCMFILDSYATQTEGVAGAGYPIFKAIAKQKPEFMLWLGDNVYLGHSDWDHLPGLYYRYTHNRSLPNLQPLLGSAHHYAIWDDHDYGTNNATRSWPHKQLSLHAFRTFWPNPSFPAGGGIYSTFQWADAQFFLLDNRFFRSSSRVPFRWRQMLGEQQLAWLLRELKNSKATFKFICIGSQVLSTASVSENYSRYGKELQQLLAGIEKEKISGVVFLDGDRHFTELSRYDRPGHYPLYGFTLSPLTASPGKGGMNRNRVDGTLVTEHNFGMLRISGSKGSRQLHLSVFSAEGTQLWQRTIREQELKD